MTKEQQNVKEFMVKAGQATPDKPIVPDVATRILRVKLLLEEVLELAEASGIEISKTSNNPLITSTDDLSIRDNPYSTINLVEVADALTDIDYVNLGAAIAYGLDLEPFQKEVQRSNMSKFIDGYRREDGKWQKGKSYSPADLKPILEKQITA
jgi:predicted HAD superfamily Cof-like phosphohydrolase